MHEFSGTHTLILRPNSARTVQLGRQGTIVDTHRWFEVRRDPGTGLICMGDWFEAGAAGSLRGDSELARKRGAGESAKGMKMIYIAKAYSTNQMDIKGVRGLPETDKKVHA